MGVAGGFGLGADLGIGGGGPAVARGGHGGGLAALAAAINDPRGAEGHDPGLAAPAGAEAAAAAGPPGGLRTHDIRVLSVLYDNNGERFREYGDAIQFLDEVVWPDSPVKGPSTVLWCLKFMKTYGGTPLGWHTKWKGLARLQDSDAGVNLHEASCRTLEVMVCFDQLNVAALAASEVLCRNLQLVEERWKEKVVGQSDGGVMQDAHIFTGQQTRGTLCICPKLSEWVAEELKKESAVLKERRKAREEHLLAKPKAKSGAG